MSCINEVFLLGHVGKDPVSRTLQSGTITTAISVATNEKFKDGVETQWHRCIATNALAKYINDTVKAGERVHIKGRLTYRTWKDKSGTNRLVTEIRIMYIILLGNPKAKAKDTKPSNITPISVPEEDDSDVPF